MERKNKRQKEKSQQRYLFRGRMLLPIKLNDKLLCVLRTKVHNFSRFHAQQMRKLICFKRCTNLFITIEMMFKVFRFIPLSLSLSILISLRIQFALRCWMIGKRISNISVKWEQLRIRRRTINIGIVRRKDIWAFWCSWPERIVWQLYSIPLCWRLNDCAEKKEGKILQHWQ